MYKEFYIQALHHDFLANPMAQDLLGLVDYIVLPS